MNVMEILRDQHCHTFLQHLIATGFMRNLDSLLERHTLFAPSDQAFRNLPDMLEKRLRTDERFLKFLVQYHMVVGKYLSHQLDGKMRIKTLAELPQASTRLYLNIYRNQESVTRTILRTSYTSSPRTISSKFQPSRQLNVQT